MMDANSAKISEVMKIIELSNRMAKTKFLLVLLITLAVILAACEPLITIRIYNQTEETLNIYTRETFIDSAAPGKKVNWQIETIYDEYEISAKDIDGDTVYDKTFTREELIRNEWRVIIPATVTSTKQSDNVTKK